MSMFEYLPLGGSSSSTYEIRLLEILPGSGIVDCKLHHVSLLSRPQYETLSYCWGRESQAVDIKVDGCSFSVTTNLHSALKSLRWPKASRFLWIDAVCINQDDTDERNTQVRIMRQIYQHASRVIIWLGESDEHTQLAFKFLDILYRWRVNMPRCENRAQLAQWLQEKVLVHLKSEKTNLEEVDLALRSVSERSWFGRVWVIQELAVARDAIVRCGQYFLEWDGFQKAFDVLIEEFPRGYWSLKEARRMFHDAEHRDLSELVISHFDFDATDPRDKVYALLGLVSNQAESGIEVDYNENVQDLWMNVTKLCLQQHGLDVLSLASGCHKIDAGATPSWVMNYNTHWLKDIRPDQAFATVPSRFESNFTACGTTSTAAAFSFEKNSLKVSGYVFDEVNNVFDYPLDNEIWYLNRDSDIYNRRKRDIHYILWLDRWYEFCRVWSSRADDNSPYLDKREVYWQLNARISARQMVRPVKTRQLFKRRETITWLFKRTGTVWGREFVSLYILNLWLISLITYLLWKVFSVDVEFFHIKELWTEGLHQRVLFTTRQGYLGVGHKSTRKGDKVVLLAGATVPFSARQTQTEGVWQVVGDMYLHGIMDGEGWEPKKCYEMVIE